MASRRDDDRDERSGRRDREPDYSNWTPDDPLEEDDEAEVQREARARARLNRLVEEFTTKKKKRGGGGLFRGRD